MYPQGFLPILDSLDQLFYNKASWSRKFCLLPRKCALSNKLIWLQYAYRGVAGWSGPGEPAYQYKWHSSKEHIIWKLKGN